MEEDLDLTVSFPDWWDEWYTELEADDPSQYKDVCKDATDNTCYLD